MDYKKKYLKYKLKYLNTKKMLGGSYMPQNCAYSTYLHDCQKCEIRDDYLGTLATMYYNNPKADAARNDCLKDRTERQAAADLRRRQQKNQKG